MKLRIIAVVFFLLCNICHAADSAFEDIVSYKRLDDTGKVILAVPSVKISLPRKSGEELYSADLTEYNIITVVFSQIGQTPRGHIRTEKIQLPSSFANLIKATGTSNEWLRNELLTNFGDPLITSHDEIEIPVGQGKAIFTAPEEYHEIEAVTPQMKDGILGAIMWGHGSDQEYIAGLNIDKKIVEWKFRIKDLDADQQLTWITKDTLLSTLYGRRCSIYAIIDIKKQAVILQGSSKPGVRYIVKDSTVSAFDANSEDQTRIFGAQ